MAFALKIELPDEFLEHWRTDRFRDSLARISCDIRTRLRDGNPGLAGLMEAEVAEMLQVSFGAADECVPGQ